MLDLGDSTSATFGGDGSLTVTRDGKPLLTTPSGTALVSRAFDADSPDGWHDPAQTTAYTFESMSARAVTIETPSPGVLHVTTQADGMPTVLMRVTLASDGGFYTGMGERYSHVSATGAIVPMHMLIDAQFESGTNDAHVPVPLLVSSNGYGVFFESHQAGAFDVAATDASTVTATFEGTDASVWFFFDRDPLEVVAKYVTQVGLPHHLPRWALGPMYWRNHWANDQAVLADAAELRNLHIPTTTMWIDDPWQTAFNTFVPNPAQFPDPPAMMAELGDLGYRVMFWSTPYLEKPGTGPDDEARDLYAQAITEPGVFVRLQDGSALAAPGNNTSDEYGMIDFTTSVGRDYWANLASRAVSLGASGFKLDYGEDVIAQFFNARLGVVYADGETDRTARTYPLGYHAAYHQALDEDAQRRRRDRARIELRGRHRSADMVWPGDLDTTFAHYGDRGWRRQRCWSAASRRVVVAAQTLAVSGFPSFGSDTGGYRNAAPTKEALFRWAEHTSLSVIMQLYGGGDGSHAPWAYDAETVVALHGPRRRSTPARALLLIGRCFGGDARDPDDPPAPARLSDRCHGPCVRRRRVHARSGSAHGARRRRGRDLAAGALSTRRVGELRTNAITVGPTEVSLPTPLGTPLLFARVGALLPMLAADIDTLVDATAGAVVTANERPTFEARGWPSGNATASFDDGTWIAIADAPQGVGVSFVPGLYAQAIVVTLDLSSRTGDTAPLTHVLVGGSDIPALATEADVRASTTSAYVLTGNTIVLLLTTSGTAWIE